jgi:hypothetical protein
MPFGVEITPDGMHPLDDAEVQAWQTGGAPVALWRQHADFVREWADAMGGEDAREVAHAEQKLSQVRTAMRQLGLTPPKLRAPLAERVDVVTP